eukprot:scaffold22580_cov210-Cylindrotheca_fusiformis.AAC.10
MICDVFVFTAIVGGVEERTSGPFLARVLRAFSRASFLQIGSMAARSPPDDDNNQQPKTFGGTVSTPCPIDLILNQQCRAFFLKMIDADSAYVLYVDHQGHPAPLSLSYHATASRRLASSIDRHPPSTITEVDSAYCPQCLAFHDANSAATMGYCPKDSCRLCPLCYSVASVVVEGSECLYKCGRSSCSWTSKECSLSTPIAVDSEGDVTKEDFEKASTELGSQWTARRDDCNKPSVDHFKTMLKTLEGMAKEQVKGQRSTLRYSSLTTAGTRRGLDDPDGWSVESLEASLQAKQSQFSTAVETQVGGQGSRPIALDQERLLDESLQNKPIQSIFLQDVAKQANSANDLLPLPIPLRPRKSRRCRAELAEGRPGILLKPKLNPLEGDSSLRTGHGQWWKKDSSAIQMVPRVRASIHASDGTRHAFLLKVSNPTLGTIRFRLAGSEYSGEPVWDGDDSERTPFLEKILVDPLNQQIVNAKLVESVGSSIQPSEICALEAGEDTFLDFGRSSNEEPIEVAKWDAGEVLADSKVSEATPSTLRVVGSRKSCAWLELVLLETSMEAGIYNAVPLSLQIEVGDGSWESSLIQPELSKDKSKDMVTFDLVVVWENLD